MSASNELCFMSAVVQRQLLDAGEVSAVELLDAHIDRIERFDGTLNAVVTRCFEEARETATRPLRGPLAGLPIAHKDLVATRGLRTTYGSVLHADNVPCEDAPIVARIKAAGAVTVGKTNTPEFGAGSQTFNRVFGATHNPYDISRTCGGSSGGAAVALAARFLPIADGSDTGGSLRNPAAFCNVVGFRPSPGRVPMAGSGLSDLSTPGPMARSVDDTALLFSVIAGPDHRSAGVLTEPGGTFRRVTPAELGNLRVAVTEDFGGLPVESEVRDVVRATAAKLEAAGARVVEACPDLSDATRIFHVLRAARFRTRFGGFSAERRAELKDTIIWNTEAGEALTLADEDWAVMARSALVARVAVFFQGVDVLLGPTTQVLPFDIETDWVREIEGQRMRTYIEWMQSCSWITVTCCPALSLPGGFASGLPVGVQLVAPMRRDGFLLSVAKAVEAITGYGRIAPALSPRPRPKRRRND